MENKPEISVISPVYQAEQIVPKLVSRICEEIDKLTVPYEIVLVEDGSQDNSWGIIEKECVKNNRVKGIKLCRNFGQHYAITAGIEAAEGNYVVVMDCDLQDNPSYIKQLLETAKKGYEVVYTKKKKRHHSFLKNLYATVYGLMFNQLTDGLNYKDSIGSYSLISRKVVRAFSQVNDYHRHYLMVLGWLGFKSTYIEIEHEDRYTGKSSYTFTKLVKHGIDGLVSQSTKLLNLSVMLGFALFILAVIAALFLIITYFTSGYKEGWASVMVMLIFSTGIILMFIGVLGLYIGKVFEQVKQRPLYIVEKKVNF